MQAVTVKCPECNAVLKVGETATVTTCTYCGAEARIQRRTQILQRLQSLPVAQPDAPARIAHEVASSGKYAILGLLPFVVIGGLLVYFIGIRPRGQMSWTSTAPIATAVNNDGVDDFVGLVRYLHNGDSIRLAAFDGTNGAQLWETDSLGSFTDFSSVTVAATGGFIVHDDKLANLYGYDAKTGKRVWKISPGENLDKVCAGDSPASLVIETADKKWHAVTVATGALVDAREHEVYYSTSEKGLPICKAVPNNNNKDGFTHEMRRHDHEHDPVPGMSVDRWLEPGDPNDHQLLAVGTKQPGSAIPTIALFDERGGIVWKTEVPGTDPLKATQSDPDCATLTATHVFSMYETKDADGDDQQWIVAFDRKSGKRLWTKPLPDDAWVVSGMTVNQKLVAVATWTPMFGFDITTGELVFTVGKL